MRNYVTISDDEKNSILNQHSGFYNGYATGNIPSGPQPLRQDKGPSDMNGINVNNRGDVSTYKNHLVNESREEEVMEYEAEDMDLSSVEPAYDFESGGPEQFDDMGDFETELEFDNKSASDEIDFPPTFGDEESDYSYSDVSYDDDFESIRNMFDGLQDYDDEEGVYEYSDMDIYEEDMEMTEGMVEGEVCEQCGGEMKEGECMECGNMYEEVDEDLMEDFKKEKSKITEMFNRFKKYN